MGQAQPCQEQHGSGLTAWIQLNCLWTVVGCFRSCLQKWRMAPSAACECGTDEQPLDYVVLNARPDGSGR